MAQEVAVLHRLNAPVVSTEVNTDTIAFQRSGQTVNSYQELMSPPETVWC